MQGSLPHVDIVPALQKKGNKECHRLIALVLRGRPDDLDDVGNKLIRSRSIFKLSKLVCVSPSMLQRN